MLSPNIGGNKTPILDKFEFKLKISELDKFCSENQLPRDALFLAGINVALNKFNFSDKNLIFYENNISSHSFLKVGIFQLRIICMKLKGNSPKIFSDMRGF